MTKFVSSLFGSSSSSKATARANELSTIASARSAQSAQDSAATTASELGSVSKNPRGRRLLLSNESGGLGSTLGTA